MIQSIHSSAFDSTYNGVFFLIADSLNLWPFALLGVTADLAESVQDFIETIASGRDPSEQS